MKTEVKFMTDTESDTYFEDEQQIKDMMNINKYKRFLRAVEEHLFRRPLKYDYKVTDNLQEMQDKYFRLKQEIFDE